MPSAGDALNFDGLGRRTALQCVAVRGREQKERLRHAPLLRTDLLRLRALPPVTGSQDEGRRPQVAVMFAIGTTVGSAVLRNRIRRRLRVAVRDCAAPLDGWSLLLTAGEAAATVPFESLRHAVHEAVQRVLGQARSPGDAADAPRSGPVRATE
jgi:ribonuclease P protein component